MSQDKTTDAKTTEAPEEKKGKSKSVWIVAVVLVVVAGAGAAFAFFWQGAGYLTTDNARVTTRLVSVSSNTPGRLERFTAFEGLHVAENQVLGWVEHGEALSSPFDGLVVQVNAVQDQLVSPMDVLAVIADTSGLHIQANIDETDIARIHVGQPAIVTIDPFGGRQFSGYIADIGQITSAELAGQALFFNTGGTFTRVTHLIPIKVKLDDPSVNLDNVIGVNARVRIPLR